MGLTHFDNDGNARMVDVSDKDITKRIAVAKGHIELSKDTFDAINNKKISKGDVITVATTAGIMAVKKNAELIPMCHNINITGTDISWYMNENINENGKCEIECEVRVSCIDKTGAEMEALTGVSVSLLTIYDMVKSIDKEMLISNICLVEKDGGKSGHYIKKNV